MATVMAIVLRLRGVVVLVLVFVLVWGMSLYDVVWVLYDIYIQNRLQNTVRDPSIFDI